MPFSPKPKYIITQKSIPIEEFYRYQDEFAWKVSIEEIEERNYNLDFKNHNGAEKVAHEDPKEVLERIAAAVKEISKLLEEIKKEL